MQPRTLLTRTLRLSSRGLYAPARPAATAQQAMAQPRMIDIGANLLDSMYAGRYNDKDYHAPDLDAVLQRSWDAGLSSNALKPVQPRPDAHTQLFLGAVSDRHMEPAQAWTRLSSLPGDCQKQRKRWRWHRRMVSGPQTSRLVKRGKDPSTVLSWDAFVCCACRAPVLHRRRASNAMWRV